MKWLIAKILLYVAWAVLAALIAYLILCVLLPPDTQLYRLIITKDPSAPVVGIAAIYGTAVGLAATTYMNRFNSIKQHTMQVLTQSRLSAEMGSHLRAVYSKFPGQTPVLDSDVSASNKADDWYRGGLYILNYYEFLAVAMRHGDLYKPLVRDCTRGLFLNVFRKLESIVKFAVTSDQSAQAAAHIGHWHTSPSKRYCDIRRLYDEWNTLT